MPRSDPEYRGYRVQFAKYVHFSYLSIAFIKALKLYSVKYVYIISNVGCLIGWFIIIFSTHIYIGPILYILMHEYNKNAIIT
jgi:hypothetical protein